MNYSEIDRQAQEMADTRPTLGRAILGVIYITIVLMHIIPLIMYIIGV